MISNYLFLVRLLEFLYVQYELKVINLLDYESKKINIMFY
jgi:hypothetical protein